MYMKAGLAAEQQANGFYGSAGFSRLIPEGYTHLEKRFWADVVRSGRAWQAATGSGVRLKEWEKEGWTYHSKGAHFVHPSDVHHTDSRHLAVAHQNAYQPFHDLHRVFQPLDPVSHPRHGAFDVAEHVFPVPTPRIGLRGQGPR